MEILTEPIASIPRSPELLRAMAGSQTQEAFTADLINEAHSDNHVLDGFTADVGRFYLQMASEPDRKRGLRLVSQLLKPHQTVFVGVIDPINADKH